MEPSFVTFKIFRFNPRKDPKPFYKEYKVPVSRYTRVLEALLWIKENVDSTLNFRYSCRMAMCGSCGMLINGKQRLACKTLVKDIDSEVILVEPLPKYPVVRDLVVDMSIFFVKHRMVKPFLLREDKEEQENPTQAYRQTPAELENFEKYARCIMCGCCSSACPNFDSQWGYLGPQALAQAYRYIADSRDEGFNERYGILTSNAGIWRCHFAGECSEVCPKEIDVAEALQLLRRKLVLKPRRV